VKISVPIAFCFLPSFLSPNKRRHDLPFIQSHGGRGVVQLGVGSEQRTWKIVARCLREIGGVIGYVGGLGSVRPMHLAAADRPRAHMQKGLRPVVAPGDVGRASTPAAFRPNSPSTATSVSLHEPGRRQSSISCRQSLVELAERPIS